MALLGGGEVRELVEWFADFFAEYDACKLVAISGYEMLMLPGQFERDEECCGGKWSFLHFWVSLVITRFSVLRFRHKDKDQLTAGLTCKLERLVGRGAGYKTHQQAYSQSSIVKYEFFPCYFHPSL